MDDILNIAEPFQKYLTLIYFSDSQVQIKKIHLFDLTRVQY